MRKSGKQEKKNPPFLLFCSGGLWPPTATIGRRYSFPSLGKLTAIFSKDWNLLREIFQCLEKPVLPVSKAWKMSLPMRVQRGSEVKLPR